MSSHAPTRKAPKTQVATAPQKSRPASANRGKELTALFRKAAKQAVLEHHQAGRSVFGSVNGRLVEVPPPNKAK
jgi:hypothetical protein